MKKFKYVLIITEPAYQFDDNNFAYPSHFGAHLLSLRDHLGPNLEELVVSTPTLSEEEYKESQHSFLSINTEKENIRLSPLRLRNKRTRDYLLWDFIPNTIRLFKVIRRNDIVHSGASHFSKPLCIVSSIFAVILRKKLVFVVDVDIEGATRWEAQTNKGSMPTELFNRLMIALTFSGPMSFCVRFSKLSLLKSKSMVERYGKGDDKVKYIIDSAYSDSDVVTNTELEDKLAALDRRDEPLRVVYFGRLLEWKRVDRAIEAVRIALNAGANLSLTIIGDGEDRERLENLVRDDDSERFKFSGNLEYGSELFEALSRMELSIYTPQYADTPRSFLDSLARGIPVISYDMDYSRELEASGGLMVVPSSVDEMAKHLTELSQDKTMLKQYVKKSVEFARENSTESWVKRRCQWVAQYCNLDIPD